ncbi:MAG: MFS transporter [Chloroflexota bacterium]|nr:MFS transporter [Chloroflexota bacterium]
MTGTEASIWRSGAFVRLWSATAVSYFGSFITRTALPLAAILVLGAGALEISALRGLELVAGLLVGLVAGAWVDRLRRRPIMIGADLGRAALLGSIPVAAVLGALALPQLLVVAFLAAILTTFFDVASRTYLPTVVSKNQLITANSALTASASVAEFSGFGISGFLIQLFTAPIAIAVDAASFVVSALALGSIRQPEPDVPAVVDREPVRREIRDGLRVVLGSPTLRAIAAAHGSTHLLWGIFGTVYLLFATRDLGLGPAAIGIIAGIGGGGSFIGAAAAGRIVTRFGIGQTMLLGMVGFTVGSALIPLAPSGAVLVAAAFLIGQQLIADTAGTVYDVVETSLTQSIVGTRVMGRVNATISTYTTLLSLIGTIAGGVIAEVLGLRAALAIGLFGGVAAFAFIWFSPIRGMRGIPAEFLLTPTPDDAPLTE